MRSKLFALAGLTLLVAGGAALAYAATGPAEAPPQPTAADCCVTVNCCDDPTCPPGCCDDCPPDCKPSTAKASCCPAEDCCPDGDCCEPAKPATKPTAKQFTGPPCPLCPGW